MFILRNGIKAVPYTRLNICTRRERPRVVPHGDEYRRPSGASIKYLGAPARMAVEIKNRGRTPDTAASAAEPNAPIYSGREY